MMLQEYETLTFQNGSVQLNAIAAGPFSGPLLILLHGFPEFSQCWRHQITPLAKAGFRVIAPDQRGYNKSTKLRGIISYSLSLLSADIIAIANHLGREQFYLAGHDWGAAVAWHIASTYPHRIAKLIILNVPHPRVLMRFLASRPRQMLRSWYMLFFQIPLLPEWLFSLNSYKLGRLSLVQSSKPGTFSESDLERYCEAWSQPNAVTCMINWYRALFRHRPQTAYGKVQSPTLILWGIRDKFLIPEMARESLEQCEDGKLIYFPDASHWLQHEEPEAVNATMIRFLS